MELATHIRCAPGALLPVGNGSHLFVTYADDGPIRLSREESAAVVASREFRAVHDVLRELASSGASIEMIDGLLAKRVLISAESLLQERSNNSARASSAPGSLSRFGVPTRCRPDYLARNLSSFAASAQRWGQNFLPIVAEDSVERDDALRSRNAAVAALGKQPAWFAGRAERAGLADVLARKAGIPRDLVEFALLGTGFAGTSTGSARNTLLLLTAGERLLTADDDAVCRVLKHKHGESGAGLRFVGHSEVNSTSFHSSRADALAHANEIDADYFGLHGQLLGAPLDGCLRKAGVAADILQSCGHMVHALTSKTGRVGLTFNGVVGDPATYSGAAFLALYDASSRERMLASEDSFLRALNARNVVRCASRTTVTHGVGSNTVAVGIDNQRITLPFLPRYWNEDGVFLALTTKCLIDTYFAHLPVALYHDPPQDQLWEKWHPGVVARELLQPVRVCDVIIGLAALVPGSPKQHEPESAIEALGNSFVSFAKMPSGDFQGLVKVALANLASERIRSLEGALERFGEKPAFWADTIRTYISALQDRLTSEDYYLPSDLLREYGAELAQPTLRKYVERVGELLTAWPSLWNAASEKREELLDACLVSDRRTQ